MKSVEDVKLFSSVTHGYNLGVEEYRYLSTPFSRLKRKT